MDPAATADTANDVHVVAFQYEVDGLGRVKSQMQDFDAAGGSVWETNVGSDKLLQFVPKVQSVSAAFAGMVLADIPFTSPHDPVTALDAVVNLAVLSAIWLAIGVWRVEKTEYALPDA